MNGPGAGDDPSITVMQQEGAGSNLCEFQSKRRRGFSVDKNLRDVQKCGKFQRKRGQRTIFHACVGIHNLLWIPMQARTRTELERTIFAESKREIFQRKPERSTRFQCSREIRLSSVKKALKEGIPWIFTVIAPFVCLC